jgi:hypothetical protein
VIPLFTKHVEKAYKGEPKNNKAWKGKQDAHSTMYDNKESG